MKEIIDEKRKNLIDAEIYFNEHNGYTKCYIRCNKGDWVI